MTNIDMMEKVHQPHTESRTSMVKTHKVCSFCFAEIQYSSYIVQSRLKINTRYIFNLYCYFSSAPAVTNITGTFWLGWPRWDTDLVRGGQCKAEIKPENLNVLQYDMLHVSTYAHVNIWVRINCHAYSVCVFSFSKMVYSIRDFYLYLKLNFRSLIIFRIGYTYP